MKKAVRLISRPFVALGRYFKGAYQEFRRVEWPNRQTIVYDTVLITLTIVIGSFLLTAVDYGLQQLTDRYLIR